MTQTDITFLTLVNKRLDHVKAYNSERHYTDHIYMARRWVKEWNRLTCGELDTEMIRLFLLKRNVTKPLQRVTLINFEQKLNRIY